MLTYMMSSNMVKNLTLTELSRIFKLYLQTCDLDHDKITILGQFSLIFNDPLFSKWHAMSKLEQSDALTEIVKLPDIYNELILSFLEYYPSR